MSLRPKSKINCCGSNFETDQVSTFGLVTFSMPFIALSLFLSTSILLFNHIPIFKKIRKQLIILTGANLSLIKKQEILPRHRCNLSAWLNPISPYASRIIYHQFNIFVLLIIWVFILSGGILIVQFSI